MACRADRDLQSAWEEIRMTSLPALQPVQTQRQPLGGAGLPEHARPRREVHRPRRLSPTPVRSPGRAVRACPNSPSRRAAHDCPRGAFASSSARMDFVHSPCPPCLCGETALTRSAVEGPRVAVRAGAAAASTEELTRTTTATDRRRCARKCVPAISSSFSPPRAAGRHAARAFVRRSVPPPRRGGRCFSRRFSPHR